MSSLPSRPESDDRVRVEALRRLDLDDSLATAALDDLVVLIAQTLDADAASLVMVEQDRAWAIASTSTLTATTDTSLQWPLARALTTSPEPLLVVAADGGSEGHGPQRTVDGEPSTALAAYAIEAPSGERIGAIEVAWEARRNIGDDSLRLLERWSRLVTRMLHLGAEVSEYGRFIELAPDPIVILDADGAIEQVNPAFLTLVGHPEPDELLGRAFLDLVDRADRTRVTAELTRALFMQRRRGQLQLSLVDSQGRRISCSVSAGHLRGPRRHLQLVLHDLSEHLRAEDERSRLSEQLARAQRLDAVGQIAGGLAHDLNNLLVVMISNLSLAGESLAAALDDGDHAALESVKHDLQEVEVAVDRAGGLTNKLLHFARQEEGAEGHADVAEVCAQVVRLVGRSLGDGVRLENTVPDDLPIVVADPVQLERILVNLVINARDAITGDGTVEIDATAIPGPSETGMSLGSTERTAVRIVVRDDGCGMDEMTRARAFEPLFTTRGAVGGSGLGLATVLAFVEEIDGQVELASAPEEGTTITLTLPATSEVSVGLPLGVDVPVAGARVLLVDPGERTRRVITTMLTGSGYRVTAVSSAEAALEVLERDPMDLLVTEFALPGMPGSRLLQKVRERAPDLPCLVVAPVGQAVSFHGTPVLAKPFSHTRLLRAVEELVRGR